MYKVEKHLSEHNRRSPKIVMRGQFLLSAHNECLWKLMSEKRERFNDLTSFVAMNLIDVNISFFVH